MKRVNIELIKEIIKNAPKNQKWIRSTYEYALSAMYPYYTEWSLKKLPELKELFYARCMTNFKSISSFTDFKGIDCYLPEVETVSESIEEEKEYNFEIYTCNPETGETGWDIKFRSVFAVSKEEAKERLKSTPLFDCIILFNFGGCPVDDETRELYLSGVKCFDRHSYMNKTITEIYK